MPHPGEALDHHRDPVQGPELPGEPVGSGAFQQRLLDGGELLIGQSWRRAARPFASQGLRAALPEVGVPDTDSLGRDLELAGDLGLADADSEQLGRAQPASLEPVTFSLCRTARDSWHPMILTRPAAELQLPHPQPDTQIPFTTRCAIGSGALG